MKIDDGDLIVKKLESRKRALEEEEKKNTRRTRSPKNKTL